MPNLIARVEGNGPGPHLVLNVHLDTMPAGDEAAWSVPPFQMTRADGRLYGLGMGNMKGAVAAMAQAFADLCDCRDTWPGTVTFTAVADECVFGPNGAEFLLETMPGLVGDAVLCGEGPGQMHVAVGEKGVAWFELSASGPGGHSSGARAGESALARMAAAVAIVEALGSELPRSTPLELASLEGDPGLELTAGVGVIESGHLISQIPTSARAEVDVRLPPGVPLDAVEGHLAARLEPLGVRVTRIKGWEGSFVDPAAGIMRAVSAAVERVRGTAPAHAIRMPASDASRWTRLGVPAVCFGPQPTAAAGVDDYAVEQDVIDCAAIYLAAARRYLTSED